MDINFELARDIGTRPQLRGVGAVLRLQVPASAWEARAGQTVTKVDVVSLSNTPPL